jgi:hypothetical protein
MNAAAASRPRCCLLAPTCALSRAAVREQPPSSL